MCGRLACGLKPNEICNSCCYKLSEENKYTIPQWKDSYNFGKAYKPSYNICPKEVAPVLLSGNLFKINSRIIAPMVFGVIPRWAKGETSKYSTINCRLETATISKLYRNLLEKGQRCAVICSGFYEWEKRKQSTNKKAYFIHGLQPDEVQIDDPKSWNMQFTSEKGFSGFRPLRLAALFEINSFQNLEEATLSCDFTVRLLSDFSDFTIITKEADHKTSWLHHRIPATLETDEQLDAWLNYEKIEANHALKCISHQSNLICVPISNVVNQVTNKDISCIKKIRNFTGRSSESFFKEWLKRKQKRKSDEMLENVCEKTKKNKF